MMTTMYESKFTVDLKRVGKYISFIYRMYHDQGWGQKEGAQAPAGAGLGY